MNEDLFRDIISKLIKGEATPHEKRMLANSLKEDSTREDIFYNHLLKHEMESPQYLPDVSNKARMYEQFVKDEIPKPFGNLNIQGHNEISTTRSANFNWWCAACLTFLLCASFYFLQHSFLYKTYSTGKGVVKSVSLEDGSTVTLNANSSIRIRRDFMAGENREVWINGEAFFEVKKKLNRMKFIVHSDNVDVEVLGTKFNVNNRRCKTQVMLAEGRVKLVAKDQKPLIMKPGEHVSVSGKQGNFQTQLVDPEKYLAWRKNRLFFQNVPLSEVAQIIEDYYAVRVLIDDPVLAARKFTGTLPNNDLDVILLALTTAYRIQFEIKGGDIILKQK